MEKIQRWIDGRDLEWARHVGIFYLLDMQLNLIWPLVKEFFQAITRFDLKIIESIVQGVPIFITKKTMAKMLQLS
jgi:hypothetical protein